MPVARDHMSRDLLTVSPGEALQEVAQRMVDRDVGAVLVMEGSDLAGILTERDVLRAVADDLDPDVETAGAHITSELVYAAPRWTLEEATEG